MWGPEMSICVMYMFGLSGCCLLLQMKSLSPIADAANLIAEKTDWPMLYDVARLNANTVPVASATYLEVR